MKNSALTSTCRNCSYSFRIFNSNSTFCSKDCETCYTIFNKSPPIFTDVNKQNLVDVRLRIFQFQQELDNN